MPSRRCSTLVLSVAVLLLGCSTPDKPSGSGDQGGAATREAGVEHRAAYADATAAYRWVDIMLEVTGREVDKVGARPTIISRQMAIPMTAMYDAWAAYDAKAVGTRLGGELRRPIVERTVANKEIAIAYAVYLTLVDLFPADKPWLAEQMRAMGHDPDDATTDLTKPQGIGRAAAMAVLAYRKDDGANQLGDQPGGKAEPYADYTGYEPVNTAYDLKKHRRWQPRLVTSRYGIARIQHFVTPQYALTEPYSYEDPTDYGVPWPDKTFGSKAKYKAQLDQVLAASAALTDEQKALSELFDDKIRSLGFSSVFASLSRGHSLMQFVHYDFTANMAAWDVGIIVWQEKTKYDAVRPFSAAVHVYGDDPVTAWGGPGMGTVDDIPASEWRPYLNTADHPEYPSGSASFCSAHAQASRLYFGDDDLNWTVPIPAGTSVVEPGVTPAVDVELFFPTWTDFETKCGYSRLDGGVHFEDAVLAGLDLGPEIGTGAYDFVQAHIAGTP